FFQAEDGIRDGHVTGVQTCALPIFDQTQAAALLAAAEDDPLEALYVLAVMLGMRQGELLGLQWADVDWEAGRVQVRHTLQWRKRSEERRVGKEWRATGAAEAGG